MTAYANFIQDFPKRSMEFLTKDYAWAEANDREITLMISIATTSIVIPYERLRSTSPKPTSDREKFDKAKQKFDRFINKKFLESDLWDNSPGWEFAEEISGEDIRENKVYLQRSNICSPVNGDKLVNWILSRVRNSISHGSIFTEPERQKKDEPVDIETIIFISGRYEKQMVGKCSCCGEPIKNRAPVDKYDLLAVSPDNFHKFLKKWIEFLESLKLE